MTVVLAPPRGFRRLLAVLTALLTLSAGLVAVAPVARAAVGIVITNIRIGSPHKNFTCTGNVVDVAVSAQVDSGDADAVMVHPMAVVTVDGTGFYGDSDTWGGSGKSYTFHLRVTVPDDFTEPSYAFHAVVTNGGVASAYTEKEQTWAAPGYNPSFKTSTAGCALVKVGAVLAIAAGAFAIWEVIAAEAAVTLVAGAGAVAKGLAGVAAGAAALLADPPDPNYTKLARPQPLTFPPPPATLTAAQRAALAAFYGPAADAAGQMRAALTSVNRAWGADDAHDQTWVARQLAAAEGFADAAAGAWGRLGATVPHLISELGIDRVTAPVGQAAVEDFRTRLANGTATDFTTGVKGEGVTTAELATLTRTLLTWNEPDPFAIGSESPAQLFGAVPEQASAMAALLRDWAVALRGGELAGPTITSVRPSSGPIAGGTRITVTGTHLETTTEIALNAVDAGDVSCSATRCSATTPASDGAGATDVDLTTMAGSTEHTAQSAYTYLAPPQVTGTIPQAGPAGGGNVVEVDGWQPDGGDGVDFGGTPATVQECHVGWCLVVVPPGTGTVDVTWTVGGTVQSERTPAGRYTYLPAARDLLAAGDFEPGGGIPAVDGYQEYDFGTRVGPWTVSPAPTATPGPDAHGGVEVVHSGLAQPFAGTQFLKFGLLSADDDSVPAKLSQQVPVQPGHRYQLDFALSGKTGEPAVKQLTVTLGRRSTELAFDTTGHTSQSQGWRAESLTASACTGATLPVTFAQVAQGARGPEVDHATLTDLGPDPACTAIPAVTGLSPATGPTRGGNTVMIRGVHLSAVTAARFGSRVVTGVVCWSDSLCEAAAPAGAGVVDLTVTAPGGTSALTAADRYRYVQPPAVTRVSPAHGSPGGGTTVTVTGTNLSGATAARFGSAAGAALRCTATRCSVRSPAGRGTVDIRITTPGGTSALSASDHFTYNAATGAFQTTSLSWLSARDGVALGLVACGVHRCPALRRTTDGGAHWYRMRTPAGAAATDRVRFATQRVGYVFGRQAFSTHDAGATWHLIQLPGARRGAAYTVPDLASARGRVYLWIRAGRSSRLYSTSIRADHPSRVLRVPAVRGDGLLAAGGPDVVATARSWAGRLAVGRASTAALAVRRTPCGTTYRLTALDVQPGILGIACDGPATANGSRVNKKLYASSDLGRHWGAISGLPQSGHTTHLATPSARHLVVVASSASGVRLELSTDGGRRWSVWLAAPGGTVTDFGFTDDRRGFLVVAARAGTTVWRTTDGGRRWTR